MGNNWSAQIFIGLKILIYRKENYHTDLREESRMEKMTCSMILFF